MQIKVKPSYYYVVSMQIKVKPSYYLCSVNANQGQTIVTGPLHSHTIEAFTQEMEPLGVRYYLLSFLVNDLLTFLPAVDKLRLPNKLFL